MKRTEFDLCLPIVMVWRDTRATKNPWRFAIWFHKRWFYFTKIAFASKGSATRIARNTLAAMRVSPIFGHHVEEC
jgi:hypothetical protein